MPLFWKNNPNSFAYIAVFIEVCISLRSRMNHTQIYSEQEMLLWNKVVNDDKKAFETLFKLFYQPLSVYAGKYIPESQICEDIAQDVFVSLWEDRKRLSIATSLRSYLVTSIRNHCLNYLRKENLNRQYRASVFDLNADVHEEDLYTFTELHEMLEKALARLPEGYRAVFEMHRLEGKKYDEIAEKMNLSLRTVKRYHSHSLEILRNELKDFLPMLFICFLLKL